MGAKVSPSTTREGPLVPAVELPAVRLTPAAAERVGVVMCEAIAEVTGAKAVCSCDNCLARRSVVLARTAESLVAELRLAGWTVAPPGQPGAAGPLKGGV